MSEKVLQLINPFFPSKSSYINSASIGIVKSNQQSILNYPSVLRLTVNSQQSTVNNNSGATGINITSLLSRQTQGSNV